MFIRTCRPSGRWWRAPSMRTSGPSATSPVPSSRWTSSRAATLWRGRKVCSPGGLRALEQAPVRAGGGVNQRGSLSDGVLVKDNHLAGLSIEAAVRRAHLRWPARSVQVECDTKEQLEEALAAGAELVLLDNMEPS